MINVSNVFLASYRRVSGTSAFMRESAHCSARLYISQPGTQQLLTLCACTHSLTANTQHMTRWLARIRLAGWAISKRLIYCWPVVPMQQPSTRKATRRCISLPMLVRSRRTHAAHDDRFMYMQKYDIANEQKSIQDTLVVLKRCSGATQVLTLYQQQGCVPYIWLRAMGNQRSLLCC